MAVHKIHNSTNEMAFNCDSRFGCVGAEFCAFCGVVVVSESHSVNKLAKCEDLMIEYECQILAQSIKSRNQHGDRR